MFEELIAHGRDMIRRLEAERMLTVKERDVLPPHRRVPIREAELWRGRVEQKIRSSFDRDTFDRYRTAWDLRKDELDQGVGDEYLRTLNAINRIVAVLEELDSRV